MQQLLQRDVRIVRWFVEERWGRRPKPESTLGQLLAISEKLDLNGPTESVESIEPEVARHLLHASAALGRLAWAIRALHGNAAIDLVDGSFIDDEVMGEDTKQPDVERRLPGGIGRHRPLGHREAVARSSSLAGSCRPVVAASSPSTARACPATTSGG